MQKLTLRVGAWASGLVVAAVLSACGGGGDSPPPAPPAPTVVPDNLSITAPATAESAAAVAFGNSAGTLAGLKYQWDFGDGATSSDAAPSHSYASGGEFEVVLKVSNDAGASRETRTKVNITNIANVRGLECTGAASTGWCWQNPKPTGNRVNTVFFLDSKTGWRGGEAGEIFKTTDAGVTWTRQSTGISTAISAIRFADASNGWATGTFGALLRTTDGGRTWALSKVGDSSINYDAGAITTVDASTVIVGRTASSGYSSGMLVSGDGGATWRTLTSAPYSITAGGKFWDFQNYTVRVSTDRGLSYATVLDARGSQNYPYFEATSFLARDDQRAALYLRTSNYDYTVQRYNYLETFHTTTDGGATWAKVEVKGAGTSTGVQRLLSFSTDGKVLVALGNSGNLTRSSDGGQTWTALVPPLTDYYYLSYVWLGGNDILASSYSGLWLSEDAGQTWLKLSPTSNSSNASILPDSVRRVDATTLVMTDSQGATYVSQDKGQSWRRIVVPVDGYYGAANALAFSDARNGFMTDSSGRSFTTKDGGMTWDLKNASFGVARTVQFINKTTGWLVGSDNRPYKTTDGGQTWLTMPAAAGVYFSGIYFQNETLGWSQRTSGGALFASTRDGGKTWTELALPAGINSLRQGEQSWVAVGSYGAIYVSTDSGGTWNAVYTGTSATLAAAAFTDAKTAWVVGSEGTLLKSEDAGARWTPVKLPGVGTGSLRDIKFASAKIGWIVGDGGLILKTQDGGKTWQPQPSGTSQPLYTIQFVDTNTAWIAGGNGVLLATGTGGN